MSPLPGSGKYQKPPTQSKRRTKTHALIDRANDFPIQTLLEDEFGIYVPIDLPRSWKAYCPFSFEHPDGGTDRTLRVYPSNTAYCFALHGMMRPVRLVMMQREIPAAAAARWILEKYGLESAALPYWERMPRLVLEHEFRTSAGGSPVHAVEALQQALLTQPGYLDRQYDPDVVEEVERWLEKLDALADVHQEGALHEWLKEALSSIGKVASVTRK